MSKFRIMANVKLNSSGPVMRVIAKKVPNIVVCDWMSGDTRIEGEFDEANLVALSDHKGHIQFRTTVTKGNDQSVNTRMRADSVNEVMLSLAELYKDAECDIAIKIKHI